MNNTLTIPKITNKETQDLIKVMKSSNATGHDSLNTKILKNSSIVIAPHITHLVNCCIRQSKFPDIYKISRILPLLKKGKDKTLLTVIDLLTIYVLLKK